MKHDMSSPIVEPVLPQGFSFRNYRDGDALNWASMEVAINDFDTVDNGVRYFQDKYVSRLSDLHQRFVCVQDSHGNAAGSVIAWYHYLGDIRIPTVHWLVVRPEYQGVGLGSPLVAKMLQVFALFGRQPVYLHTQPWSYKAIALYAKHGFYLLKTETIMHYENQYDEAMPILKRIMKPEVFRKLMDEAR